MPEGWVTAQEAAKELGIEQSVLRRLCIKRRIVGAEKVAGVWLIPTPVKRIRAAKGPPGRDVRGLGPDIA